MKTKTSEAIQFITTSAVLAALYAALTIAFLFPIISNVFIIGWELTYFGESFWFSVGHVVLGEAVVLIAGYILYFLLSKRQYFYRLIDATQHIDFKW